MNTTKAIKASAAKLRGAAGLACCVKIYVPGTMGTAQTTDNAAYIRRAAVFLSGAFGGATAQETTGYWLSDVAGLVEEKTTIVYSFCNAESLTAAADSIVEFCETMKKELIQEAVSLEVNGVLYLI
jgi:hypothetical protein